MEIKYRNIVLRDMEARDIEDEIRWNTAETQWSLWDAPWEELDPAFDPEAYRKRELENLAKPLPELRTTLELDTADGTHIGAVSSYLTDENYSWIPRNARQPGQTVFHTLGLDINESGFWGRGLGKQALAAWISYFLEKGVRDLYLQTWSGNTRMVHIAERLGFVICCRKERIRQVRGGVYDGLTFRLDLSRYRQYQLEENLQDLALSPETAQAVLAAYSRRPAFFEAAAGRAYSGEIPDFPICQRSPWERLVIWCRLLTEVRKKYQQAGVPYATVVDTFGDIALRARLYEEKNGKPGLSRDDVIWFRHLHDRRIFRLGSLQFQPFEMIYLDEEGCGEAYMEFSPEQKRRLPQGAPVLNLHIPKGADLSPAAVEASFSQALTFFRRHFPDWKPRAFLCYTWLLYPDMKRLLPPESRILRFASRFQIIGKCQDPAEAIRRIYGRRYATKGEYPQKTALQRAALGHFSSLGEACGIVPIEKT